MEPSPKYKPADKVRWLDSLHCKWSTGCCSFFSVEIGGKSYGSRKAGSYGNGMKTLRLRSKGTATVEVVMCSYIVHGKAKVSA